MRVALLVTAVAVLATASPAGSTWSGQNGALAYSSKQNGNRDIYALTFGGTAKRLTTNTAADSQPSWSPDGAKLAFISNRTKPAQVWLMNANGSGQRALTSIKGDVFSPTWAPDGRSIYYSRLVDTAKSFVMEIRNVHINATGDHRVLAGRTEGEYVSWPRALADGRIAFLRRTNETFNQSDLCLVNADGSNVTVVASGNIADFDTRANELLTFEWTDVRVRGVDGSVRQTVDARVNGSVALHAIFAPDGESILYTSAGGLDHGVLTQIPLDGSPRTTLTAPTDSINSDFSWQALR